MFQKTRHPEALTPFLVSLIYTVLQCVLNKLKWSALQKDKMPFISSSNLSHLPSSAPVPNCSSSSIMGPELRQVLSLHLPQEYNPHPSTHHTLLHVWLHAPNRLRSVLAEATHQWLFHVCTNLKYIVRVNIQQGKWSRSERGCSDPHVRFR